MVAVAVSVRGDESKNKKKIDTKRRDAKKKLSK